MSHRPTLPASKAPRPSWRAGAWLGLAMATLGAPAPGRAGPALGDEGSNRPQMALHRPWAVPVEALVRVEFDGRAHPAEAAEAARDLLGGLAPESLERVEALLLQGAFLANARDAAAAQAVAGQLDALAAAPATSPAQKALAVACAAFVRGNVAFVSGALPVADTQLDEAVRRLPANASTALQLRFVGLLARARERGRRYDEAVSLNLQAIALADRVGPLWRRADLRSALSYELFMAGQNERSEQVTREAMALAHEADDPLSLCIALNSQGYIFNRRGDAHGEISTMIAAVANARRAGARVEESQSLANLSDFYLSHGRYATALEVSLQALTLTRLLHNAQAEMVAQVNAGYSLIELGRKEEGHARVQSALELARRTGSSGMIADLYEEWGQHLEHTGALRDASAAYRAYRRMAADGFRRDQQRAILEQQERYDDEKRKRDLALLNREHRLRTEQLLHHDLTLRTWAVVALSGLALLGLLGLLYRRVRRNNAALSVVNGRLKIQSEVDPLTGLSNRRHFHRMVQQAQATGWQAALFLVDIDHFKRINDGYGHPAGDAVLVEVARRLRAILRDQDLAVRWGGEEFLIVVDGLEQHQAEALSQRLLEAIAGATIGAGPYDLSVSVSVGYGCFSMQAGRQGLHWERALELVDKAMYVAKQSGRNGAAGFRKMDRETLAALEPSELSLASTLQDGRDVLAMQRGPRQAMREFA